MCASNGLVGTNGTHPYPQYSLLISILSVPLRAMPLPGYPADAWGVPLLPMHFFLARWPSLTRGF